MNRTAFALLIIILSVCSVAANKPLRPVTVSPSTEYTKTESDLEAFLKTDTTDTNTWTTTFTCVNFSNMLVKHARAAGFDAEPVIVVFVAVRDGYQAHEFVAFSTVDNGIVWVEPQDDSIYLIPRGGLRSMTTEPKGTFLCDKNDGYCWPDAVWYFDTINAFNLYGYPNQ